MQDMTYADLNTGDYVRESGLLIELGERREYTDPGRSVGTIISFAGRIANPEYLTTDTGRYLFGGIIPLDGSSGWTVQGVATARVRVALAVGA